MENHVKQIIEQCSTDSFAGNVSFGTVVAALMQAGVESYHADYRIPATTYYLPSGATHTLPLRTPNVEIAQHFDTPALQASIRDAQRGEVKYPEFIARSMAAGCVGYIVWIGGRHVTYLGRRGEIHTEHFPHSG